MSISSQTANPIVSRRILVIEDNLDSAEVLQTYLEIHGHEITVRHDGQSGIDCVRELVPDVVICDISLSGEIDGYNVAEEIRRHDHLRSIFLIALSGYGRSEDKEKSRAAGFDSHFVKPTDFDALLELINSFDRL
ncbi:MAG: response regulator [Acidobacteria bacterium]|nr:response regulator [Acidobacteriota bacterium]